MYPLFFAINKCVPEDMVRKIGQCTIHIYMLSIFFPIKILVLSIDFHICLLDIHSLQLRQHVGFACGDQVSKPVLW